MMGLVSWTRFTATMLFFMWLAMRPEHHNPRLDGHPKHDTCSGHRGEEPPDTSSGAVCGMPWDWDH